MNDVLKAVDNYRSWSGGYTDDDLDPREVFLHEKQRYNPCSHDFDHPCDECEEFVARCLEVVEHERKWRAVHGW